MPCASQARGRWLVWLLLWLPTVTGWGAPQIFRAATFNVENYLDASSGTRHAKSPAAQAKVRDCILALKPDVIALQEMGSTNALLDLQSAADQVEVARSSVDLADQTLAQARDRFTAGVTDNLEVVQAQESLAAANESYISSLYAHNLAKIELARAIGFAEEGVKQYLQGK